MYQEDCIACATLRGHYQPPGGIVFENDYWCFWLRSRPVLIPGQGFIVLKRHCEHLNELTPDELATLGLMIQHTHNALKIVIQPSKVHFGLYAEEVKHIHLHILPRSSEMPASNIAITFLQVWFKFLAYLHLKRPYSDTAVAVVAQQLRDCI